MAVLRLMRNHQASSHVFSWHRNQLHRGYVIGPDSGVSVMDYVFEVGVLTAAVSSVFAALWIQRRRRQNVLSLKWGHKIGPLSLERNCRDYLQHAGWDVDSQKNEMTIRRPGVTLRLSILWGEITSDLLATAKKNGINVVVTDTNPSAAMYYKAADLGISVIHYHSLYSICDANMI